MISFVLFLALASSPKHPKNSATPQQRVAAVAPEPEWEVVSVKIDEKTYDCEFNSITELYYFMGRDGIVTVEDSCFEAVTVWSHTWPIQLYKI